MTQIDYKSTLEDRINKRMQILKALDTNKKKALAIEYYRHNLIDFFNFTIKVI